MKKILFLIFFSVSSLFAVEIKSIKFDGLVQLSPTMAEEISGLKVGQEIHMLKIEKAIKNLFKQNYFEDIWIDEDNGNLTIFVKEKPVIARIVLDGVAENDKEALTSGLGIKKGMVFDFANINLAKTRIKQFFQAKGYFDTIVEVKDKRISKEGENDSLEVTFFVNRGENIIIKKVELCGAKEFDYSDIEPAIANKEREFMGWMWGLNDGKLKVYDLPTDSERIKDEYYKKGFLDAKISTPFLKFYNDSYTAKLTYNIYEGQVYHIGNIEIKVPDSLINASELEKDLALQEGDVVNSKKIRNDIEKIETKIADLGYAFVKAYPDVIKNEENLTVDLVYKVNLGEKVRVNRVLISGNNKTVDRVIRRELYLTEGNLYNRTNLNDSKDALKRTGYFEDVQIKEERITRNLVDITVIVKETSTGDIRGGIGYGSSDGLLLSAGVSDSNIFGSGIKGSVDVDRSDNELTGRISLSNPRVFDSVYSTSASVYIEDNDWTNYEEKSEGFFLNVGRKIGRNTHVSLGYVLEQSDLSNLNESLLAQGYKEGKSLKSSIIPTIKYDNTDDYYLPRRGITASASLEYAGVGGDEKFIVNFYKFAIFQGLEDFIDYDLILRYKAQLGIMWDKGYIPINEKLYLGGIRTVRGYDSKSISPRSSAGYATGGKKTFNNSFELSFPLINRLRMRGALFFDYGMIGEDKFDDIERASTGLNFEWISPMGAINLIFAEPIMNKPGDEISRFEFTIGRRF